MKEIEMQMTNGVRMLGVDAIQQANSGHPGIVLGAAPMAVELFAHHMYHDVEDPNWVNRDRFVLSAGHGSAMLYALLHVYGYLEMEEVKNFRQWGSLTPGHPEYGLTKGVDATTGPLGQGVSMAVGMAMAEQHLAAVFNKENFDVFDHYTYVLAGDGCMQEGITSEASSFAGTMQLDKLIVLYDSNHITIEGRTELSFTEEVAQRYQSYHWQVLRVADGEDMQEIADKIEQAKAEKQKPTLIIVSTEIGKHSKLEGSEASHGAALGKENIADLRKTLHWDFAPFELPETIYEQAKQQIEQRGKKKRLAWQEMMQAYKEKYPALYTTYLQYMGQEKIDIDWENLVSFEGSLATRATSGLVLNALADKLTNLFGGSADLGPSNQSVMKQYRYFDAENRAGRNVHFGIREHAMGAIVNGMALHGGMLPYGATFLVFSDYMRASIRQSALMDLPVFHIFTHDSIGVGEDGPTHQPIEHLAALRTIPNYTVFRPADGKETLAAYQYLIENQKPGMLALSRQGLPQLENSNIEKAAKGGYVLQDAKEADVVLIGTGSEVALCVEAAKQLATENISARVVSMPCIELFLKQEKEYQKSVLQDATPKVAVEAGVSFGWQRIVKEEGCVIGIDHFGASAPGDKLFQEYGFTVEHVVEKVKACIQ